MVNVIEETSCLINIFIYFVNVKHILIVIPAVPVALAYISSILILCDTLREPEPFGAAKQTLHL